MSSLSYSFNIGAVIKGKSALVATILGSSAAAPTTQDGVAIDRQLAGQRQYYSCKAIVAGLFTGSSSQLTAGVSLNFQHADSSGGPWTSYSTGTVPATVTVGATSAGNSKNTTGGEPFEVEQSVNLNGAKRWLRVQIPPITLATSSSGESVAVGVAIVFGGGDELPAQ